MRCENHRGFQTRHHQTKGKIGEALYLTYMCNSSELRGDVWGPLSMLRRRLPNVCHASLAPRAAKVRRSVETPPVLGLTPLLSGCIPSSWFLRMCRNVPRFQKAAGCATCSLITILVSGDQKHWGMLTNLTETSIKMWNLLPYCFLVMPYQEHYGWLYLLLAFLPVCWGFF